MVKNTLKNLYNKYELENDLAKKNILKTKILLLENKMTYKDIINWLNNNTSYEIGFLANPSDYNRFLELYGDGSCCEASKFIEDFLNGNLKDNRYFNNANNLFYVDNPCLGVDLFNIYDIHNGLYAMLFYLLDDWGLYVKPKEYNCFLKLF